jgi:uncharacterized membrane protein YfcA
VAELELLTMALLLGAAFIGSVISGFLGMGGGIFLLTVLFLCGLDAAVVIPVHALIQLTSNSTRVALFAKDVRRPALLVFCLCALPFPVLGLAIAGHLDAETTKVLIGILVLFAVWKPKGWRVGWRERSAFATVGVIAGTLGVVVGATGPLIAPFFLREGWRKEEIIATKAACQVFVHIQKIVAFGLVGFAFADELPRVVPLALMVVLGTVVGKKFLRRLTERQFRLAYRLVLTVLALRLVVSAWT